jgi:hypothetical protein
MRWPHFGDRPRGDSLWRWALGVVGTAVLGALALGGVRLATGHLPLLHRAPLPPLTFSVTHEEEGFVVVAIPRRSTTLAKLGRARDCAELEAAARQGGGADPKATRLRLLVHGHSADGVTITAMRAVVVSQSKPKGGAEAWCEGGGALGPIPITLSLDSSAPVARYFTEHGHAVSVANNETVSFYIQAKSTLSLVAWKLAVTGDLGNGHSRTFLIDVTLRTSPERRGTPLYEWRWWHHPADMLVSAHT